MLARSFVFLPGIGPTREEALWARGVDSWDAYRRLQRVPGIKPRLKAQHERILDAAAARIDDPAFWARQLPSEEHWRAFRSFSKDAAYLDIETTGDRANHVTLVGIRFRGEDHVFVRGLGSTHLDTGCALHEWTPEAVTEFTQDASCLVTFNGSSFDKPMLENQGVEFPDIPHVDLRTVFSKLDIGGGLKKIEEQLGMLREDSVQGLTGWDAVKLWRKWSDRRDEVALRTLIVYNLADFANLEPLAGYACDTLATKLAAVFRDQQRLTVEVN